jgi:hypothetical protein
VLIDKALTRGYVLSPLAAPHHRRDGLVFRWPSDKGTQVRPSPGGGRGHHRVTYEQVYRLPDLNCPANRQSRASRRSRASRWPLRRPAALVPRRTKTRCLLDTSKHRPPLWASTTVQWPPRRLPHPREAVTWPRQHGRYRNRRQACVSGRCCSRLLLSAGVAGADEWIGDQALLRSSRADAAGRRRSRRLENRQNRVSRFWRKGRYGAPMWNPLCTATATHRQPTRSVGVGAADSGPRRARQPSNAFHP